jgi:hypothetical protein
MTKQAVGGPIDPAVPGTLILSGRIVTMDAGRRVIDDGRLYVKDSVIVAAQPAPAPASAGFRGVHPLHTKGTMSLGSSNSTITCRTTSCSCGTCRSST